MESNFAAGFVGGRAEWKAYYKWLRDQCLYTLYPSGLTENLLMNNLEDCRFLISS